MAKKKVLKTKAIRNDFSFTKRTIEDRISTTDDLFTITDEGENKRLTPDTSGVQKEGTNINADLLQRYEDALDFLINQKPQLDHPVNSVEINVSGTNPADYLGFGTWEEIAKGKALVGVDTDDDDFNEAEKTGGEKEHQLSVEEMPSHTHTPKMGTLGLSMCNGGSDDPNNYGIEDHLYAPYAYLYNESTGGNGSHNNLQPYFCVHIFKRTA